tara:strand:- start:268 stop:585 length:318 start_codon:yes stop_codon:yes gene_type:complete
MGLTIQQYPLGELAADVYARIANSPLSCLKVSVKDPDSEMSKTGFAINYTVKFYKSADSVNTIIPTAYEQGQFIVDAVENVNLYDAAYSHLKSLLDQRKLTWTDE